MTPADAAARADRDAAATPAWLDDDVLDLFIFGAMVGNRTYSYLESVAALGYDPMSERSQAAEKDER